MLIGQSGALLQWNNGKKWMRIRFKKVYFYFPIIFNFYSLLHITHRAAESRYS